LNCAITDDTLQYLSPPISLEFLKLSGAQLEGNTLTQLTALKNLKKLDITGCSLNNRKLSNLRELHKQLPSLHISQHDSHHVDTYYEVFIEILGIFVEAFVDLLYAFAMILLVEVMLIVVTILIIDLCTDRELLFAAWDGIRNAIKTT
jgi:hypothetical protein